MSELNPQRNPAQERVQANDKLKAVGGLSMLSKSLGTQLQLKNLRYFGSEKDTDVENREDFLGGEEFQEARTEMKDKLNTLIELLEKGTDVSKNADAQKMKIELEMSEKMSKIFEKSRPLEKAWRELDLFFTNAAQRELRNLVVMNVNHDQVDESVVTKKVSDMLEEVNKSAIDQSKSYSMLVIPYNTTKKKNFDKWRKLIERYSDIAYNNKVLFMTDYEDLKSVDDVMEAATDPDKPRLGGVNKSWSRTVVYTNYALMRDKHKLGSNVLEKEMLYASPAAAVAGKMYAIDNIAQPIAGAQFGVLKGLQGLRYKVSQEQANVLDRENLNPMTNAFGGLMAFNCVTMFKGENVELRQYSVIRTLDYIDRLLKHFLNQYVFTSMQDSDIRAHVHKTIMKMLERLVELKILKKGGIQHFSIDEDRPDRFNIKLEVVPMYVTSAFEYTIGIDPNGVSEGEGND